MRPGALTAALFFAAAFLLAQNSQQTESVLAIQSAIEAGDLPGASSLIDDALKHYPNTGGLLNLRGIVSARQGELDTARKDFAEATRLEPKLTPAWQNLARACESLAASDSSALSCATSSWRAVSRLKPGDAEALTEFALVLATSGNYVDSLRAIGTMGASLSGQPNNLIVRCVDLLSIGRQREAQTLMARLAADSNLSEADLEKPIRLLQQPQSASLTATLIESINSRTAVGIPGLQKLAVAYEQLGRMSDAIRTLERIASIEPSNTAHLLELARLAELGKHYEQALGYLAHARDLDPKNAQIHFLFGVVAEEMELPIEARSSLERAIALSPENPTYHYALGAILLNTRDALTSAKHFEKFVSEKPADPRGHYALGIAYFAAGDYDGAKREMMEVEHDPKALGGVNYFLGRIARADGEIADATMRLRQSIDVMPNFSESHTELARVFMDEDKLLEAHGELEKALQLDPNSFQGNNQLLVLYRRLHDPRGDAQAELLRKLDENRSRRAELMLRTIEAHP